MFSSLRTIWRVFLHMFAQAGDHPVSGGEEEARAALARAHHPVDAIPTAASAASPATCARWPARSTASRSRRPRTRTGGATRSSSASTSRAASSAGSARKPARPTPSSSRPTSRWASTTARTWCTRRRTCSIDGPGKYPDYNFYRVAGMAIGGKDKGEASTRPAGRPAEPAALTQQILFYIASLIAIVATLLVVTRSNAVHALLYLIVSLLARGGGLLRRSARRSSRRSRSSSTPARSWCCSCSW